MAKIRPSQRLYEKIESARGFLEIVASLADLSYPEIFLFDCLDSEGTEYLGGKNPSVYTFP